MKRIDWGFVPKRKTWCIVGYVDGRRVRIFRNWEQARAWRIS